MTELRQRDPRVECPAFLAFVRTKPCAACKRAAPSQAAHLRMGCLAIGKRPTGIAEKPSDRWSNPLCADCHLDAPDAQHRVGEPEFWKRVGVDPFENAMALYAEFEATHPQSDIKPKRKKKSQRLRNADYLPHRRVPNRPKARIAKRANFKWPKRPFASKSPRK